MANKSQETSSLLAPMIKKTLWAVLSTARVSCAEMEPHAAEHLRYMNSLEAKGLLGEFLRPRSRFHLYC
jgi:hypothetical protein